MGLLQEILGSVARTLLPAATAWLAGQGVSFGPDSDPTTIVLVAVVVYGIMQAWSIVRKVINKPRSS